VTTQTAETETEAQSFIERVVKPQGSPYGICGDCRGIVWEGRADADRGRGQSVYCQDHLPKDYRGVAVTDGVVELPLTVESVPDSEASRIVVATAVWAVRFEQAGSGQETQYWASALGRLWGYSHRGEDDDYTQVIRERKDPVLDYRKHILDYAQRHSASAGKYGDPSGWEIAYSDLRNDRRFDRDAFNAAMTALESEGQIIYYRKAWWLPADKARYQEIHSRRSANRRPAPTDRKGMA
jgi:hypothetical protein